MFNQVPDQLVRQIAMVIKKLLTDIQSNDTIWSIREQDFEVIESPRFSHRLYGRLSSISSTTPQQAQILIRQTLGYQGYEILQNLKEDQLEQIARELVRLETDPCASEGYSWHLAYDFQGIPHPLPFAINSIVFRLFPVQIEIILRAAVEDIGSELDVWKATKELDPLQFLEVIRAYIQDKKLTAEGLSSTRKWMREVFGEYGLNLIRKLETKEIASRGMDIINSRHSDTRNIPHASSYSLPRIAEPVVSAMSVLIRKPILEKAFDTILGDIFSAPDTWSLSSQQTVLNFWEVANLYDVIKGSKPSKMHTWLVEQIGQACLERLRTLEIDSKHYLIEKIVMDINFSKLEIPERNAKDAKIPVVFRSIRDWMKWNECKDNNKI